MLFKCHDSVKENCSVPLHVVVDLSSLNCVFLCTENKFLCLQPGLAKANSLVVLFEATDFKVVNLF